MDMIKIQYTNSQRISKNAIEINFRFKDLGLNINAYHYKKNKSNENQNWAGIQGSLHGKEFVMGNIA